MLEIYSNNQIVSNNFLLPFTSVALQKGDSQQLSGTNSIIINKCGLYELTLEVSGLPSEAGDVLIEMTKNNVVQSQAKIFIPTAITTTGVSGSLTTFIQTSTNVNRCCCSSPTTIQFNNAGVGLTSANIHLAIRKIH